MKPKLAIGFALSALVIVAMGLFVFGQNRIEPSETNNANLPRELVIKGAVYQDLLGSPSKDAAKFEGALFLEATESETNYLRSLFVNWQPRVEVGATNNLIITKSNVIDRLTGKPATLYWARVVSQTNQTAQAVGGTYSTSEAGAEYHYQFTFDGTNWIIKSKKQSMVW